MQTVRILHCADLHLGAALSALGPLAEQRRADALLTFEKIIETARDEQVKLLLISGDLFDGNRAGEELIDRVLAGFSSLPGTEIFVVCGNHDPLRSDSPFSGRELPANLHLFGGEDGCFPLPELGVRVYGRSFTDAYCRGKERFSIAPPEDDLCNLMVLHGEAKSDLNSDYNAVTPGFVRASGMDYIALGHIHARSEIQQLGRTRFAYCGCPEGLGFDETGEKGVYLGEVGKDFCDLRFVPLCRRMHLCETVNLTGLADPAEIVPAVLDTLQKKHGEHFSDHLYKIVFTGEVSESFDLPAAELQQRLSDRLYYVKVSDHTTVRIDPETVAAEPSLQGIFAKNMLKMLEDADETKKETLKLALQLGWKAFRTEVKYGED